MIDIPPITLFTIEDAEIQDLNGGIRKKFTSLANSPVTYTHIYDPTIFKWDFGDGSPIYETSGRVTYRTYSRPGTYLVRHQACNFCSCSDWNVCSQSIAVAYDFSSLAMAGIIGFLIFKGIDCEPRATKERCEELRDYCRWAEKEKKCVRECKEEYKLEKERTEPFKLKCVSTKELSKEKSESLKEKK